MQFYIKSIKITRVLVLAVFVVTSSVFALYGGGNSDSEQSPADIEVVQSIKINKKKDLNFGKITSPGSGTGTAMVFQFYDILITNNLTHFGGTVHRAEFEVTGQNNAGYEVHLPNDGDVSMDNGNIILNDFTLDPQSASNLALGSNGKQTIWVAATAEVDANVNSGSFSEEFTVQVNSI